MDFNIEVGYLDGVKDALGDTVSKDIEDLGIDSVDAVRTALLYRINGDLDRKKIDSICKNLLTDPVIQWYKAREGNENENKPAGDGFIADVFFKKGVTDAVGDSVKLGIKDMGIKGVESARTGVRYMITGGVSREVIKRICQSLLANSVIQDYIISG